MSMKAVKSGSDYVLNGRKLSYSRAAPITLPSSLPWLKAPALLFPGR